MAASRPSPSSTDRDRLCERLLTLGPDLISDEDILEFLLSIAVSRRQARRLAKTLLQRYLSLARMISAPVWDLLKIDGLGAKGVALLKAMDTVSLRKVRAELLNKPVLEGWDRLIPYLHAQLSREQVEEFHVLFLDSRNRLLADEIQQRGTVNQAPVYPREVVKRALELQATALILVHNHPSGDPTPSREDIVMTEMVSAAAAPLSIVVHDHIVMGNGLWFSFRKQGLLGRLITERIKTPSNKVSECKDVAIATGPSIGATVDTPQLPYAPGGLSCGAHTEGQDVGSASQNPLHGS